MTLCWRRVTLEQVAAEITVGYVGPMADEYTHSGVPFLRSLNIEPFTINFENLKYISHKFHNKIKKSSLYPGDVVIVRTGKPGSCTVVPEWMTESNCSDVVIVRVGPEIRAEYLSFIINYTARKYIYAHTVGAVQQHFNVGAARKIKFDLPSILEQDRILSVLGTLNKKIELNRQMNETLEATARALFRDWFVDFGPTRAKMEGRAPYLAPEIWDLFPDRLDDAGLPEGWQSGTLGDVVEFAPPEPLPRGAEAPYLDMAALPTAGSNPDEPIIRPFSSGTRFRNGDTLFARITPCLENGKTAFVQNLPQDAVGWGSTEFIVMRSRQPVPPAVSYIVAREPELRAHAIRSMTGTSGRQRASTEAISAFAFSRPEENKLWLALESLFRPLFDRIASNALESRTLAATRDLLLPKLMSGEIRVGEAAESVAGVT